MVPQASWAAWSLLTSTSSMTGFSPLPLAEEEQDDQRQFKGIARILGPRWAHLPSITIGLLGVQIFWSVEMSYGMSAIRFCIIRFWSLVHSFTLPAFVGPLKVKYGNSLRCWSYFRAHYAASHWQASRQTYPKHIHWILVFNRCLGRSFYIAFRSSETLHVNGHIYLYAGHAITGFHTTRCIHIHWLE